MVTLNETIEYLDKFGVLAKCNGFDDQAMYFQVRRSQNDKGWVDYLLNVNADGIPQLDYDRKSWTQQAKERKMAQPSQRRIMSWLEKLLG